MVQVSEADSHFIAQEEAGGPYGWATMHAKVREEGILISNHTMRQGDRGVVIVGGSVELGTSPLLTQFLSKLRFDKCDLK